ncbi:MAG: divalent-cation tolerance protein CutA [Hyphomicrobiales bacterium]|nr:divalent-cation tolerance protein CutA [Hyphomicrobiales bacterium]
MSTTLLYVTTSDRDAAARLGRVVVEERLAACANVIPGVSSIYIWEDELREDEEAVLILKTKDDLVESLIERVKDLHDYECPCVVALSIVGGNQAFLDWVDGETHLQA